MNNKPVVFIAFLEQDNLGVGYIASMLLKHHIDVKLIDFRVGKEHILAKLSEYDPLIVGFSVIFQYHIYEFRNLVNFLRENGVDCHFSAGGHYPSLRYGELFNIIPQLDSIVLFEGEHTFLELVSAIRTQSSWKDIQGLAYQDRGKIVTTPLRPLENDLDNFPPPVRQPLKEIALGKKYATILAGRGCYYDCSFCSIREFYSKPPGPIKRIRRPEMVVREMELLHEQLDCSIFMFQDDDFPVMGTKGAAWTSKFCELLDQKGLSNKILWKINCRTDEVKPDLYKQMQDAGLFLVYLGIEDGTDDGLKLMNKHITSETNVQAVNTLKQLGIEYDFGFMLFHPETTFQSILSNLDFLSEICGDGSSPITFCKMLPYAETKVEHRLKTEGRLIGKPGFEDYDFADASLGDLYVFMADCYQDWVGGHDGVLTLARWVRMYLAIHKKFDPASTEIRKLELAIQGCIARSNRLFVDTTRELVPLFSSRRYRENGSGELIAIKNKIKREHTGYQLELSGIINALSSKHGNPALERQTVELFQA